MSKDFTFIKDFLKDNGTFEFYTEEGTKSFKSIQCLHCGSHYQVIPGSGKQRGYCLKCKGFLCGKEDCLKDCVPYEARIEIEEGNKKTTQRYLNTQWVQKYLALQKQNKEVR